MTVGVTVDVTVDPEVPERHGRITAIWFVQTAVLPAAAGGTATCGALDEQRDRVVDRLCRPASKQITDHLGHFDADAGLTQTEPLIEQVGSLLATSSRMFCNVSSRSLRSVTTARRR